MSVAAKHPLMDSASARIATGFFDENGHRSFAAIADHFGMSKRQLAETLGLSPDTVFRAARLRSSATQARIGEMLEIVGFVSEWAGGDLQAMAWYRAEPIPSFGMRTPESLVKGGLASAVRIYLDHVALGGFA